MKSKILVIICILAALNASCKKEPAEEKTYPTDGLVSYFNFDDNLSDQLASTPDGVNHGGATFVDGKAGKAISLSGAGQYIEFERKTFRNGNIVSVSAWFKRTGTMGLYFVICNDFGLFTHSEGYTGMAVSVPTTSNAHSNFTANEWVHIAGTYDGTTIKTYINGELKATLNWPGDISGWDEYLKIGNFYSEYWSGCVDDLFIYNKVLSQSEVEQLYNLH